MRILGYVSHAWPHQRGGSETSFHAAMSWLAGRGHDVRVLVMRHKGTTVDGVQYAQRSARGQAEWFDWADVVVDQQGSTTNSCILAGPKPAAHWAHNWHYMDIHADEMRPGDLVMWNSEALADAQGARWSGRSMVLHPPTFAERWSGSGDRVTQVNLSALKGGELFWKLARIMPELDFLGVEGWGDQIAGNLPNVQRICSTPDMLAVYRRTRVLLVPTLPVSERQNGESWGMAAAEAAACGIPVVASKSPGMVEQFGDAAIWCDPYDVSEWVEALERLADPDEWARASKAISTRTADPTVELEAFEMHLSEMCGALV